ncbi:MAG: 6-carboxytetrahydropterin synthase [Rikenellaceae bacterium]
MSIVRVTKEFAFEMAHALDNYDGHCRHVHGHSYKLFVTVKGEPSTDDNSPKCGMVIDFGVLKRIVNEEIISKYDHALVLRSRDSKTEVLEQLERTFGNVITVDYQSTCENMVVRFAESIQRRLPEGLELFCVKLHETATSYAEWYASDNKSE